MTVVPAQTVEHPLPTAEDIEREVDRRLARRLVSESPFAEAIHVALVLMAALLVWPFAPHDHVFLWVLAVTAGAIGRSVLRTRARRLGLGRRGTRMSVRAGVALLGFGWAAGLMLVGPNIPLEPLAFITVILAGLVSGATVSLLADPVAFYILLSTLLGPLSVTIAMNGSARSHVIGVALIGIYGLAMSVFYRRSHGQLRSQLRTERQLEIAAKAAEDARQAEEYLVRIIEATTDHVGMAGPDSTLRYVNREGRRMIGMGPVDDLTRMSIWDIIPRRLHEQVRAEVMPVVAEQGSWSGETFLQHRDGSEIPVSLVALAHKDRDGNLEALSAIARDMRAQVAVREALREARDEAQQATAAKSAFLANTSHEVRTPLNGILGMVELLLDTELTESQRRAAELIAQSGESLLATINDLLDLSKIEAHQLEMERIGFDLHHVVHSTVRLLMTRAHEKHIELVSDVGRHVPQHVVGDPHRLRQVLTNLVGNAVKFTDQGEVVVTARLVGKRGGLPHVRIGVRDTGIGITSEQLQRVFEPFQQADVSTTRYYGGTGLGLSIARRLVSLMGGTLEVTSTPGEGTEFFFTLPFTESQDAPREVRTPGVRLAGTRVLVADDHATNRRVTSGMLRWAGCDVEEVSSAPAALDMLRSAAEEGIPYRVLASDVQMPGIDGFELARRVREDPELRETRIMLLTSVGQRGDGQRCRDLGVNAYLQKPLSRVELVEATAAALDESPQEGKRPARRSLVTRHSIDETRQHLRILLAEDNPVNQEVAKALLLKRGHEVTIVENGRQAVEAVQRDPGFNVVLMDIQMPELDGVGATREIRALGIDGLPIVAVTANVSAAERERCLAAGMNGYLTKPFKPHELYAVVEGWLGGVAAEQPAPVSAMPLDVEALRKSLAAGGVGEILPKMLTVFRADAPLRHRTLVEALTRGNMDDVARAAHAYKSGAGNLMANTLFDLLREMEAAAHAGDAAEVSRLAPLIEREHQRVVEQLDALTSRQQTAEDAEDAEGR